MKALVVEIIFCGITVFKKYLSMFSCFDCQKKAVTVLVPSLCSIETNITFVCLPAFFKVLIHKYKSDLVCKQALNRNLRAFTGTRGMAPLEAALKKQPERFAIPRYCTLFYGCYTVGLPISC